MKLIRASKDLRIGEVQVKKGCLGVVLPMGVTLHAGMVSTSMMGPVFESWVLPQEGFEEMEVPGDGVLAQKVADHLHWSLDPADPFTNEMSSLMKDVIRRLPRAELILSRRLAEMV